MSRYHSSKAAIGPVGVLIGKKKLSAGMFTVVKPRITSITPTEAEWGMMLTITGEHFCATAGAGRFSMTS